MAQVRDVAPAAEGLEHAMRAQADFGGGRVQPARVQVARQCHRAAGQPPACIGRLGLPVDSDHVRAGRPGDLLDRPPGARREHDHRCPRLPREPRGFREVRQRELPEVPRRERARP